MAKYAEGGEIPSGTPEPPSLADSCGYLMWAPELTEEQWAELRERLGQATLRPTSLLVNGEVKLRRLPWRRRLRRKRLGLHWWQREAP